MYADRVKGGRGRGRGSRPTPYSRPGGGEEAAADACTVFVGNLPYETTWKELKDHMKQAGEVAHADVMEGPDGRSKGTGLVRYYSEEDAAHAIETLSESEIDGRTIFVRADRGGGGGGKGKGKGSKGSKGGSKGKGKGGGKGGGDYTPREGKGERSGKGKGTPREGGKGGFRGEGGKGGGRGGGGKGDGAGRTGGGRGGGGGGRNKDFDTFGDMALSNGGRGGKGESNGIPVATSA